MQSPSHARPILTAVGALALAGAAWGQTTQPGTPPAPANSAVMVPAPEQRVASEDELERVARAQGYPQQLHAIVRKHFGRMRAPEIRARGLDELRQYTDPAAFRPMWREVREEKDDVRLPVLDHFVSQGEDGQAALAWVAIHEDGSSASSSAMQHEAGRRLTSPASPPVVEVLNSALLNSDDGLASRAAMISGSLNALETIPQLILGQTIVPTFAGDQGDLAWIAVGKQTAYVQNLIPIVNNGAVAFQPILGVVTEGFVLRVHDAVVVIYRHEVHRVLVSMTTQDWGQPTDELAYDTNAWVSWYNDEYVPYKNDQIRLAQLAAPPETEGDG